MIIILVFSIIILIYHILENYVIVPFVWLKRYKKKYNKNIKYTEVLSLLFSYNKEKVDVKNNNVLNYLREHIEK